MKINEETYLEKNVETITVLCVMPKSNYYKIPGLDLWDKERNAYNFNEPKPIIAHPPCQQWGKFKWRAHQDKKEYELGPYCIEHVKKYGGIIEHPVGSTLFKYMGITSGIIKVKQIWWGYPAIKETLLWYNQLKPMSYPITLDQRGKKIEKMHTNSRNKMTLPFCEWLVKNMTEHDYYTKPW